MASLFHNTFSSLNCPTSICSYRTGKLSRVQWGSTIANQTVEGIQYQLGRFLKAHVLVLLLTSLSGLRCKFLVMFSETKHVTNKGWYQTTLFIETDLRYSHGRVIRYVDLISTILRHSGQTHIGRSNWVGVQWCKVRCKYIWIYKVWLCMGDTVCTFVWGSVYIILWITDYVSLHCQFPLEISL